MFAPGNIESTSENSGEIETSSGAGYPRLSIKDGHICWWSWLHCGNSSFWIRKTSTIDGPMAHLDPLWPLRKLYQITTATVAGSKYLLLSIRTVEQLWLKTGLLTDPTYNVQYLATMHFDGDVCMCYHIISDQIISYHIYIYSIIIYHIHLWYTL